MSDLTTLRDLARLSNESPYQREDLASCQQALRALAKRFEPSRPARRVTELLGVVMALSARTRRMVMPPAHIELDVFGPDGRRAVQMMIRRID